MMNSQIIITITISVVLLSFVLMTEAGPTRKTCSNDDECSSALACRGKICVDPCRTDVENQICTVVNHNPEYTCMPGYKFPPGTTITCIPTTYSCQENGNSVRCGGQGY